MFGERTCAPHAGHAQQDLNKGAKIGKDTKEDTTPPARCVLSA